MARINISNGTVIGDIANFSKNKKVMTSEVCPEDMGMIVDITVNKTYSYKERAIVREYICNARDAHSYKGNLDQPFDIVAPTILDPVFKVRDYGNGLSEEEFEKIFINIARSTKREDGKSDGCYGIGAKSAFCRVNEFLVRIWHGGRERVNLGHMSKDKKLFWVVVSDEPSDKPTGVEIEIAVNPNDIDTFREEIVTIVSNLQNCAVPNIINMAKEDYAPEQVLMRGTNWFIKGDKIESGNNRRYDYSRGRYMNYGKITAIHGNVGYYVDLSNVKGITQEIPDITNLYFVFELGSVENPPSRETLEYTPKTICALNEQIKVFNKEINAISQKEIDKASNIVEALKYIPFFSSHDKFNYKGINLGVFNDLGKDNFEAFYKKDKNGFYKSAGSTRYNNSVAFNSEGLSDILLILDDDKRIPSRLNNWASGKTNINRFVGIKADDDLYKKLGVDLFPKSHVVKISEMKIPEIDRSNSVSYQRSIASNFLKLTMGFYNSSGCLTGSYYNQWKVKNSKIHKISELPQGKKVYVPFHGHSIEGIDINKTVYDWLMENVPNKTLYGVRRKAVDSLDNKEWITVKEFVIEKVQKMMDSLTGEELEFYREDYCLSHSFEYAFVDSPKFKEILGCYEQFNKANKKVDKALISVAQTVAKNETSSIIDPLTIGEKAKTKEKVAEIYKKYPLLEFLKNNIDKDSKPAILDYIKERE